MFIAEDGDTAELAAGGRELSVPNELYNGSSPTFGEYQMYSVDSVRDYVLRAYNFYLFNIYIYIYTRVTI